MKVKRFNALVCLTAFTIALTGCNDGNDDFIPEDINITVPVSPKSLAEIKNQNDVELLRKLATDNGFADDFSLDDPSKWGKDNLELIWEKDSEGLFYLIGMKGGAGLKTLELMDSENTFSDLMEIEITAPKLSTLSLSQLPALKRLAINGKEGSEVAPLERFHLSKLPKLEILELKKLPNLAHSNDGDSYWENSVKLLDVYDYPMLHQVIIEGTGIKDFYLSSKEVVDLQLKDNLSVQGLYIDNVKMPELSFGSVQYSELTNLKLTHLSNDSANELNVNGCEKLTDITIQYAPSINNLVLANTPLLNRIDIDNTGISTINSESLSQLKELVRLNLTNSEVSELDLSTLPKATKLNLSHNRIVSTEDIKLPSGVTDIILSGNEGLNYVDLTAYEALQNVVIIGYKRGVDEVNTSNPNSLKVFKLGKANDLYNLNLKNNSLEEVLDGVNTYPKLEQVDFTNNMITPIGFAKILVSTKPAVDDEYLEWSDSDYFTVLPLRPFNVKVENNQVDLSEAVNLFKSIDLEPFEISLYKDGSTTAYSEDNYTYDYEQGILSFTESGTYKLRISMQEPELFRLFMFDNYDSAPFEIQL